jgi:hypothetical protein
MKQTRKALLAASITCIILLAVTAVSLLTAQVVSKSSVDVTVTEPHGRTVAGLEKGQFAVTEGGVQRTITAFTELWEQKPKDVVHYKVEFESAGEGAKVGVVLNPPSGLPALTVTWK